VTALRNFHKKDRIKSGLFLLVFTLQGLMGAEGQCPYPLDSINALIREGKIHDAYLQAQKAYQEGCADPEHAALYAKLAWWNHHPYEAFSLIKQVPKDSKLYKNIYASKVLADLKKGKHTEIPSFLRNHYDILILRYQRAMKAGHYALAHRLANRLYRAYPNKEARSLQALSLMAMKRYEESLAIYRELGDSKRIQALNTLITERKLHSLNDQITRTWHGGDRPGARELFLTLTEEEKKLFREHYPINTCRVESLHMAGVGVEWIHHDDHRYRDRTFYVEGTFPVDRYTIYAKAQHTERYGDEDQKFSVEIYPPGSEGTWGYLSLSVSDQGGFYSDYSLGGYIYHQFGDYQLGVGYLYSHYSDTIAHMLQLDVTRYMSDFMTLRGVAYYEIISGSYALEAEWRYHTPCHVDLRFDYIYTHSNERLSDNDIEKGRSHKVMLSAEYPLTRSVTVGGRLTWERHMAPIRYDSYGVNIFIRKYW